MADGVELDTWFPCIDQCIFPYIHCFGWKPVKSVQERKLQSYCFTPEEKSFIQKQSDPVVPESFHLEITVPISWVLDTTTCLNTEGLCLWQYLHLVGNRTGKRDRSRLGQWVVYWLTVLFDAVLWVRSFSELLVEGFFPLVSVSMGSDSIP